MQTKLLLLLSVVLMGMSALTTAFTTTTTSHPSHTHGPHSTPSNVGGELDHLIKAEVRLLLQQDPGLTVDNCSTKCDALFDLVSHSHERATDALCHYECKRLINGHGHHHTTTLPLP